MFAKLLKWIGIALGGLIVIAAIAVGVLYAIATARLTKKYEVRPESLVIPSDPASVELGKKWATALCADCHGSDFAGTAMLDDPTIGYLAASNLTSGAGGSGSEMTDADWILAIRHGVDPHEGRALLVMPSMNYYYLNDKDLGAIIAYIKTVPPVDHELGETGLSFAGKALLGAGLFGKNTLPAEVIAHTAPRPSVVEPQANAAYGEYLVRIEGCRDCHGENLTGGKSAEPGAKHAPDITSNGLLRTWSLEKFVKFVRTKNGPAMPWAILKPLDDTELNAILLYLQSLPSE
jgi:mono/diheme cytochrome c family protein